MRHPVAFGYALLCYLLSVRAVVYLVGFLANIVLPKTIDSGRAGGAAAAVVIDLVLLALFAVPHSLMARQNFKAWLTRRLPAPLERSTYSLVAACLLGLLYWQWRPLPQTLWNVQSRIAMDALWALYAGGWLVSLLCLRTLGVFDLFGLKEVYRYTRGESYEPPPMATAGLYRYVRHPLYLGFLIAIWSTPAMSHGHLLFSCAMTVYLFVGTAFEERDLKRRFGADYERYRDGVPAWIPRPPRRLGNRSKAVLAGVAIVLVLALGVAGHWAAEVPGLHRLALRLTTEVIPLVPGQDRTLDLADPREARLWQAEHASLHSGPAGLRIDITGDDPMVRRRLLVPSAALRSIEVRVSAPPRSPLHVYFQIAGKESEKTAIDAVPAESGSATLLVKVPAGACCSHDVEGLRLDPGPEDLTLTLRSVTLRALPAPAPANQPNVLLVSLDTMRADALAGAPFLSNLARQGRNFTRAYSSSNWTLPAHVSLMTSLSYREHNTPPPEWNPARPGARMPGAQPTLAELLRRAGYATAASTEGGFLDPSYGFDRGFDRYAQFAAPANGKGLETLPQHVQFARRFARTASGRPFFLFVHTYLVHDYFTNRAAYHEDLLPEDTRYTAAGSFQGSLHSAVGRPPAGFLQRLYASGVRQADRFVARLIAKVQAESGARPLIVIVTADHGESFGEHGFWHHGTSLHEEQVRVPLLAWTSDGSIPAGAWEGEVGLVDIAPSLLRAVNLAAPDSYRGATDRFQTDLPTDSRPVEIRGGAVDWDRGVGEFEDAFVSGGWKSTRLDTFEGRTVRSECYDLRTDAHEARNLVRSDPRCQALAEGQSRLIESPGPGRAVVPADSAVRISFAGRSWRERGFIAVRSSRPSPAPLLSPRSTVLSWDRPGERLVFYLLPGGAPILSLQMGTRVVAKNVTLAQLFGAGGQGSADSPAARKTDPQSRELIERLRSLGYLK